MKKSVTLIIGILAWISVVAQAPQSFKYQAVARDGSGEVLPNRNVTVKISIIQGTVTGTVVYNELHSKTTTAFGLFDLEIGSGTMPGGTFSAINWSADKFFLKVELDTAGGIAFQHMGTSPLLSVPYALYAQDVGNKNDADADPANELQSLSVSGTTMSLSKGGGTVAVPSDNWGADYVNTDATLTGQGTNASQLKIADGGVTSAKIQDGSIVTSDLADGTVTTAKLGNLAVSAEKIQNGAVTSGKLANEAVITDKINNGAVTGAKIPQGGASSGQVMKWDGSIWGPGMDLTGATPPGGTSGQVQFNSAGTFGGDGTFFWDNANKRLGLGTNAPEYKLHVTSFINGTGIFASASQSSGWVTAIKGTTQSSSGSAIEGYASNTSGTARGIYGYSGSTIGFSGYYEGGKFYVGGNVGIGTEAPEYPLHVITDKVNGIGIYGISKSSLGTGVYGYGQSTGVQGQSTSGVAVYGVGTSTSGTNYGISGHTQSESGYSGYFSGGKFWVNGKVGIGTGLYAGNPDYQLDVNGEIASRSASGFRIRGTSRSTIFRSDDSDFYIMATSSGDPDGTWSTLRPFIFNLTTGTTWLGGQTLTVMHGGNVGIGTTTPNYKLDVRGTIGNNTTLYHSDKRWKTDIQSLKYGLIDLMALNCVSYHWNIIDYPDMGFEKEIQFGFIAQEFEEVIPELVRTDKDGYKSIDYVKLTPLLVKAIKEQHEIIKCMKAENVLTNARLEKMESLMGLSSEK